MRSSGSRAASAERSRTIDEERGGEKGKKRKCKRKRAHRMKNGVEVCKVSSNGFGLHMNFASKNVN